MPAVAMSLIHQYCGDMTDSSKTRKHQLLKPDMVVIDKSHIMLPCQLLCCCRCCVSGTTFLEPASVGFRIVER